MKEGDIYKCLRCLSLDENGKICFVTLKYYDKNSALWVVEAVGFGMCPVSSEHLVPISNEELFEI